MTVTLNPSNIALAPAITSSVSWWDPDTECTVLISHPAVDENLWADYLEGAVSSYRRHGVAAALDFEALREEADTALFFAVVDASGRVVGGLRAKGPLTCADASHAVVEWAGRPGEDQVRKMIDDRVPFGVLEMKTAWVTHDMHRSRHVTRTLARSAAHTMTILDNQFCMATSADHVLERWRSSGGHVADIPATSYPDDRYRTRMMWWDRWTYARSAQPAQLSRIMAERRHVTAALEGRVRVGSAAGV